MVLVDETTVRRGNHAFSRGEPAQNFDIVCIATAELDLALGRTAAALVDDEDPVSAGIVEEGAIGDEHGLRRIAQRQLRLDRLPALDSGRCRAIKQQVDLELAVANLGVDLRDLEAVRLAVEICSRALPDLDSTQVEFV